VTRDDTRLISDIEKLIKKKLDIEAIELEDDRPRRPRRHDDEPAESVAPERAVQAERPRRSYAAPADPFFDKPYEPSGSGEPAWEKAKSATAAPARAGLSPNIRPKKKVAALLGGGR
jgi:hypothetical protein